MNFLLGLAIGFLLGMFKDKVELSGDLNQSIKVSFVKPGA